MSFTAAFPSTCDNCEERILVGDEVQYIGRGEDRALVHVSCEAHQIDRKTETCTECWLIKPCSCD